MGAIEDPIVVAPYNTKCDNKGRVARNMKKSPVPYNIKCHIKGYYGIAAEQIDSVVLFHAISKLAAVYCRKLRPNDMESLSTTVARRPYNICFSLFGWTSCYDLYPNQTSDGGLRK